MSSRMPRREGAPGRHRAAQPAHDARTAGGAAPAHSARPAHMARPSRGQRPGRIVRALPGSRRARFAALAVACAVLVGVGGTLAWYSETSGLTNLFSRGTVEVEVGEVFTEGGFEKTDVVVKAPTASTQTRMYVRARVDVGWEDAQGNALFDPPVAKPAGTGGPNPPGPAAYDYALTWGPAVLDVAGTEPKPNSWVRAADGFLYYTSALEPGQSSEVLIASCVESMGRHADGRKLTVDIATQSIQADPARAFSDAWGATSGLEVGANGTLVARGATGNSGGVR